MKNSLATNKNQISYPFQACVPEIRFLTREEQMKLHHVSYQYRYGYFVRLTLYTGIRLGELLALRWEDVDMCSGLLYIRRSMYRRLKKEQSANSEGNETETVIQAPKSHNSIRRVPLLPAVMQDLMKWREVQWNDRIEAGTSYQDSGFIVTDPQGNCLNPYAFFEQCMQMKKSANIEYFSPHALRTTFTVRAVEQGVNPQALSQIMGYSTINSHSYISGGYETGYPAQMGGLFAIGENMTRKWDFLLYLLLWRMAIINFTVQISQKF